MRRAVVSQGHRWVIKVGSTVLTAAGRGLDQALIESLAATLLTLREQEREALLVSSGAVAAGMVRLGWTQRPRRLHQLQAAAAVGQRVDWYRPTSRR
jgi:glutamate 5-kinase